MRSENKTKSITFHRYNLPPGANEVAALDAEANHVRHIADKTIHFVKQWSFNDNNNDKNGGKN